MVSPVRLEFWSLGLRSLSLEIRLITEKDLYGLWKANGLPTRTGVSLVTGERHEHFWATGEYRRQGITYSVVTTLLTEPENTWQLDVDYDPIVESGEGRRRLPRALGEVIGSLENFLDDLAITGSIECRGYGHLPLDTYESIVRLPLLSMDIDDSPFDEIRGVHLVKRSKDKKRIEHGVALDQFSEDDVHVHVTCSFDSAVDSALPRVALRRCLSVRDQFVRERVSPVK